MELQKISDRVFYLPHQPETDRPMLAYLKGKKMTLAIDAGNSAKHVDEFYNALDAEGLKKPDFTIITHWHWDHTFGMHHIHGLSIAHHKTNELLSNEISNLLKPEYIEYLKNDNEDIAKEYSGNEPIVVVLSDMQFEKEITLNLGKMTARIFHAESPHTLDTALIYIPEEKILFLGDSTSEDFSNNGYMDKDKLKTLINMIESTDCKYCILSHTEPLSKSDLLRFLRTL